VRLRQLQRDRVVPEEDAVRDEPEPRDDAVGEHALRQPAASPANTAGSSRKNAIAPVSRGLAMLCAVVTRKNRVPPRRQLVSR